MVQKSFFSGFDFEWLADSFSTFPLQTLRPVSSRVEAIGFKRPSLGSAPASCSSRWFAPSVLCWDPLGRIPGMLDHAGTVAWSRWFS